MPGSLNYSFRNPKNIIWVIYHIKELRNYKENHGVLRGPHLGKQSWRVRFGILRVIEGSNLLVLLFSFMEVIVLNPASISINKFSRKLRKLKYEMFTHGIKITTQFFVLSNTTLHSITEILPYFQADTTHQPIRCTVIFSLEISEKKIMNVF